MTMIQISDAQKDKLSNYAEKVLHYAGKMMQCIETIDDGGEDFGERRYEERGGSGFGRRMGMRDDEMEDYGERRGVRGTGPYSRYR